MSGHTPNDGVMVYLLPELDQGIPELLDNLRCNLAASDVRKQCPHIVLFDQSKASGVASQWYQFFHPPYTA